jgi:uncharacterized protein (TIGR00369 family)
VTDTFAAQQDRIRASFDRQGLMHHLGAAILSIAPGEVVIALPARPELTQQHGYFHAGATTSIADTAGGYAAMTRFEIDEEVLAVEFKINLIAPGKGERLEATGKVVRSGRTLTVCQLEVHAIDGDERTLIAIGQQTLIRVKAQ